MRLIDLATGEDFVPPAVEGMMFTCRKCSEQPSYRYDQLEEHAKSHANDGKAYTGLDEIRRRHADFEPFKPGEIIVVEIEEGTKYMAFSFIFVRS